MSLMTSADIITMAFRNLLKRKLRTFLTIFGVVIGTASIVVMISLGLAMNKTFEEQLKNLGDITIITVYKPWDSSGMMMGGGGGVVFGGNSGGRSKTPTKLDDNAITYFKTIPGVIAATPTIETYLFAKSGRYTGSFSIKGIDPAVMHLFGYEVAEGRLLQEGDKFDVVYGSQVPYFFSKPGSFSRFNEGSAPPINVLEDRVQFSYDWNFINPYQDQQPQDNKIPPKPYTIRGAGILKEKGYETDYYVFMSIEEVKKIIDAKEKFDAQQRAEWGGGTRAPQEKDTQYQTVYVKCADYKTVKQINQVIKDMGFDTYIPSQQLDAMQEMAGSLQQLLGAIGAVSLFVSAIGIANTMIMSIYERTKEIGVMKVIGALLSDIGRLFLLEASIIGFFGGALGVLLSLLISYFLNSSGVSFMGTINEQLANVQGTVSLITPWLCGLAVVFAGIVGLISGYFPARRAMRINALTAIRTE